MCSHAARPGQCRYARREHFALHAMSMIPESSELAGLMRGPGAEPCDDDAAAGGCKAIVAIALRRPNAVAKWLQVREAPTHLCPGPSPGWVPLRLRSDGYVLERAPEPRMHAHADRARWENERWVAGSALGPIAAWHAHPSQVLGPEDATTGSHSDPFCLRATISAQPASPAPSAAIYASPT